ncbi:MAG: HAD-IB family hydrolase [Acidimicrobiales bacterium]
MTDRTVPSGRTPDPAPTADPPDQGPTVAFFDLDLTLTTHDTFVPFLIRVAGITAVVRALGAAARTGRRQGRDAAKAVVVAALWGGRSQAELDEAADAHAAMVLGPGRGRPWSPRLRPNVLARLDRHRALGHDVAIVSASLAPYVGRIGAGLGVTGTSATEIELVDGAATGRLAGANCRGPEKVARAEALIADLDWSRAWAYGDSSGDADLLAAAAHPVWVRRGGNLDGSGPG